MKFIGDLHIHSKYSRATAKNLDLENLYVEARKKGITVLGTGDCTHPAWFAELRKKLVPAEDGLYRLRPDIEAACEAMVPQACRGQVRYILESEISSIYKKNGKTRKNHNLVFFPDLDSAERFNHKLDAIGNIKSDGRPILGIDAKHLLELMLETHDQSFMIPAHIWTPWFSLLGSKSGFDTLEECFEDLTPEIFAVETGLSSDPPMNWRVSFLDGLTLVSNSDAHSPGKLGREANLFNTDLSYPAIRSALETGNPEHFLGTMEFFPEEGKYHHDGHRKCEVSLSPEESVRRKGLCPVCGKPMTLGVNYRVLELADRPEGQLPEIHHPFYSIIPLDEVIAEIMDCGPKTKKVGTHLAKAVELLGPEFGILRDVSISDIKQTGIPLLGEAIERIRNNCLNIQPGYDGEFGKVRIFTEDEKEELMGQTMLFSFLTPQDDPRFFKAGSRKHKGDIPGRETPSDKIDDEKKEALNPLQEQVVQHSGGPLLVVAGPGTGKTHTLIRCIGRLMTEEKVAPEHILAITFTVKAAREMGERLAYLCGKNEKLPLTVTFHALGHHLLREWAGKNAPFSVIDEEGKQAIIKDILLQHAIDSQVLSVRNAQAMIEHAKQYILGPDDDLDPIALDIGCEPELCANVYQGYQSRLSDENLRDFDDLVCETVRILESDTERLTRCRERFTHVFVDEYQDLNHGQYRMVRALCPDEARLTVIGDPDQAIYGFRGSDSGYFLRFRQDYPAAGIIRLNRNYRSTDTVLTSAYAMISKGNDSDFLPRTPLWSGREGSPTITVFENPTEKSEGTAIGKCIEQLMGGTGFHSVDFNGDALLEDSNLGFSDFAVLTRTGEQGRVIVEALEKGGIPCQYISRDTLFRIPVISGLVTCLKLYYQLPCSHHERQALTCLHPEGQSYIQPLIEHLPADPVRDQLKTLAGLIPGLDKILAPAKIQTCYQRLLDMASPFDRDGRDYLKTLMLSTDQDLYDLNAEKVPVMTMHASKGLEFKVVFVAGCENGLIPFIKNGDNPSDLAEERRLFYVAMTRAKDLLFLSYARKRTRYGQTEKKERSPFLKDIPRNLLRYEVPNFTRMDESKKPVQLSLF